MQYVTMQSSTHLKQCSLLFRNTYNINRCMRGNVIQSEKGLGSFNCTYFLFKCGIDACVLCPNFS